MVVSQPPAWVMTAHSIGLGAYSEESLERVQKHFRSWGNVCEKKNKPLQMSK